VLHRANDKLSEDITSWADDAHANLPTRVRWMNDVALDRGAIQRDSRRPSVSECFLLSGSQFDVARDEFQNSIPEEVRRRIRFLSVGAMLSLGELPRGSFLPCGITESSEIVVSCDHAYDLNVGRVCRRLAMQAYVEYLHRLVENHDPSLNGWALEQVYNRVISACACGIPQARMAADMSNLRAYWLPRLSGK